MSIHHSFEPSLLSFCFPIWLYSSVERVVTPFFCFSLFVAIIFAFIVGVIQLGSLSLMVTVLMGKAEATK